MALGGGLVAISSSLMYVYIPQEGMVATQWHNSKVQTSFIQPDGSVVVIGAGEAIDRFFEGTFQYDMRWVDMGVLVGFCVLNLLLVTLALKFIQIGTR